MTEMPPNPFLPNSISYKAFADAWTGRQAVAYELAAVLQSPMVQAADGAGHQEQFYFLTDVATGTMVHSHGIQQVLGYPEKAFNLKKFMQQLQGAHAAALAFYAAAVYQHVSHLPVKRSEALSHSTLSLKALSGHYWYCKRSIYPVPVDGHKKPPVLLHAFTLVKEHDNEVFSMRIPSLTGKPEQAFLTTLQQLFATHSGFSQQEYHILRQYAATPAMSTAQIAGLLSIQKSTAETYHQRIIRKTEDLYYVTPASAKDAALYFRRLRFI
jgi:DNA-binding CsgD family transcriptional regulator